MPRDDAALLKTLRQRLGHAVTLDGRRLILRDLLAGDACLVLERADSSGTLQADQYGEARRRTPELITLPLRLSNGALHPAARALLAL